MRKWIICAAVLGAACATGSGDIPKAAPPQADYRIGREDVLEVVVWHEPDLSRVVPVRPDGKIAIPLVGELQAAGRTPDEIRITITKALARYVRDVQVGVLVREVNSPKVYVLGEVHRPGVFPLRSGLSVVQALALAGGVDEFASGDVVWLRQRPDGKVERLSLSYGELVKGEVEGVLWLGAGDVIYVP